ncbi:hypothetical protein ACQ4LE_007937 [Meloidogyne hapla]
MFFFIIIFLLKLIQLIYSQQYTNNDLNKIYPSGYSNQQQNPFYYQNKFIGQKGLTPYSTFGRSPSSSFVYPPIPTNYYFGSNGYGTNLGNYYQPYHEINNGKSINDCIPSSPINSPNNGNLQQFVTGGRPPYPPPTYHGGTIDFGGNSRQNYNSNGSPPYFYKSSQYFNGEGENQSPNISPYIRWPIQMKERKN